MLISVFLNGTKIERFVVVDNQILASWVLARLQCKCLEKDVLT